MQYTTTKGQKRQKSPISYYKKYSRNLHNNNIDWWWWIFKRNKKHSIFR